MITKKHVITKKFLNIKHISFRNINPNFTVLQFHFQKYDFHFTLTNSIIKYIHDT